MKIEHMTAFPEVVSDPVATLARSNEKLVSILAEQLGKPTAAGGAAEVEKLRLAQERIDELETALASTHWQLYEEGKELAQCKRDLGALRDADAAKDLENQSLKEQLVREKKKVSAAEKKLAAAFKQKDPDVTANSGQTTKLALVDRAWKKFADVWSEESSGDLDAAFSQLEKAMRNLLEGK